MFSVHSKSYQAKARNQKTPANTWHPHFDHPTSRRKENPEKYTFKSPDQQDPTSQSTQMIQQNEPRYEHPKKTHSNWNTIKFIGKWKYHPEEHQIMNFKQMGLNKNWKEMTSSQP